MRLGWSLFIAISFFFAGVACGESPPEPRIETFEGLEAGQSVSRELPLDGTHIYRWYWPEPRYMWGMVYQPTVDLVLRWIGPEGRVLRRIDGGGTEVEEGFALVAEEAGEYLLEISAKKADEDSRGQYTVELFEERSLRQTDGERVETWSLFQDGRRSYQLGSYDEAREAFEESLARFEAVGDPLGEAMTLQQLGWLASYQQDDDRSARDFYKRALDQFEKTSIETLKFDLVSDLAAVEQRLGNLEKSVSLYDRAVTFFERSGKEQSHAMSLTGKGLALRDLGRKREAREALEAALVLHRKLRGHKRWEVSTLNGLGRIESDLGSLLSALEWHEQALEVAKKIDWQNGIIRSLLHLGGCYRRLGEFEESLRLLEQASAQNEVGGGGSAMKRDLIVMLSLTWLEIGDLDQAWDLAIKALEMSRSAKNPVMLAEAHFYLASIDRWRGDVAAAQEHYEHARRALGRGQERDLESLILIGLARCMMELDSLQAAERTLIEARTHASSAGTVKTQLIVDTELGELYRHQGAFERSRELLLATRDRAREYGMTSWEAYSGGSLARLERAQGRLSAAYKEIEASIALYEKLRSRVGDADVRALFLARRLEDYRFAVSVLLEMHEREPALGYDVLALAAQERTRARTLLEVLRGARVDPDRDLPLELREHRRAAIGRLTQVQSQLLELLESPRVSAEELDRRQAELQDVIREIDRLDRDARRGPRPLTSRPLDLPAIQAQLGPDTLLVEYALGEPTSYVFLITDSGLSIRELPAEAEITRQVDRLKDQLKTPSRRSMELQRVAHELYGILVAPFEAVAADKRHLVVVPDGKLFYLPFETLRRQPPGAGRLGDGYLLTSWSVTYAPSAMALAELGDRRAVPKDPLEFVAFSRSPAQASTEPRKPPVTRSLTIDRGPTLGPLPHARDEVLRIAELFPPETVRTHFDEDANEYEVKNSEDLRRARRLHFAVHGLIDERRSAYSGLVMGRDDTAEDGLLQVYEIFDLEISADLVVLSACETGLGRQVRGEGLLGLSRAFFYAGAPLLTVSLWPVEDQSTAELMTEFYRSIRDGSAPHEALRLAKLKILEQERSSHPFYWAPFVLFGQSSVTEGSMGPE